LLTTSRDQLVLWVETAAAILEIQRGLPHSEQPPNKVGLMDLIAARLVQIDPHFARGAELPADIRDREKDFTRQTLRGILEFLATQPSSGL